jgi:hypothetical protein
VRLDDRLSGREISEIIIHSPTEILSCILSTSYALMMCRSRVYENITKNLRVLSYGIRVRRGADESLVFPASYFPVCSTTKIFLGWVKEVRTTKS